MRPDHAAARADLDATPAELAAAAAYIERYPRHAPDALTDTRRKRRRMTAQAFDGGAGWAARLALCTGRLALFTLHTKRLGLDDRDAEPGGILDPATVRRIKAAVRRLFRGPCYVKLELGENGRVHVHVIAGIDDGPPDLPRPSQLVKPIYDLEGAVSYLQKPAIPYTPEGLAVYLKARRSLRRLPRLSCTFNLPRTAPILKPSGLRNSNAPAPISRPAVAPVPARPGPPQSPRFVSRVFPRGGFSELPQRGSGACLRCGGAGGVVRPSRGGREPP